MPRLLALLLALAFACGNADDADRGDSDTTAAADSAAGGDEIPSRAAEVERDQGSKPQEVFDFMEIEPGDAVVDVLAGGGYHTFLLSQRVGPEGRVWAQGYSPGLAARVERGDLAEATNVELVDSLSQLPEESVDHVLIVRAYHLFEDADALFAALHRTLVPGGTVGVVEVRLGQEEGHDMETHRMGEKTVIDAFTAAGFEYVGESEALRNPDDDHTGFWEGRRHLTDRMLLKFAEPSTAVPAPTTAGR